MSNPPNVRKRSPQSRLGVSGTAGAGTRRGMEAGAGLGVEVDRIARNASRGARAATGRGVYLDAVEVGPTTIANNGTLDVPITPGHLWAMTVVIEWHGTETDLNSWPYPYNPWNPSVVPTDAPPLFPGEVWFGGGADLRDKQIVSIMPSGSSGSYTASGFVGRDESTTLHARAFPPAGYPTTITCTLTVTADHLRPL